MILRPLTFYKASDILAICNWTGHRLAGDGEAVVPTTNRSRDRWISPVMKCIICANASANSYEIMASENRRELGNKKVYDPRSYLALAETAMAERVKQAATDLRASGKTMFAS